MCKVDYDPVGFFIINAILIRKSYYTGRYHVILLRVMHLQVVAEHLTHIKIASLLGYTLQRKMMIAL